MRLALNCHTSYNFPMNISDWNLALGVLRQANWLKAYPIELAERLLAEGRLVHLNAGEWAQSEGDDRSGLYVVMEGVLHTYCSAPGDRLVMIGLAEAGAVLGHATRFSGGPRLVTAVCVEPCVLLEISEAALERVAESQADIWRAIADFTYANMRSVLRMAADAISLPPRQHIVARLLAAAAVGDSAEIPVVRISQDLLGEMIGVTRKTVNHHLSKLERDGLLKLGYGRIELLDLERLRAVANG